MLLQKHVVFATYATEIEHVYNELLTRVFPKAALGKLYIRGKEVIYNVIMYAYCRYLAFCGSRYSRLLSYRLWVFLSLYLPALFNSEGKYPPSCAVSFATPLFQLLMYLDNLPVFRVSFRTVQIENLVCYNWFGHILIYATNRMITQKKSRCFFAPTITIYFQACFWLFKSLFINKKAPA